MTSEFPLVSVGLPVFNAEKTIVRALDSLLAQDYPNLEVVVSDNSSDDKTVNICKLYTEKDNRIKLNINRNNLGVNANFEIVYNKAVGKYFMWAGSDDFWEPEFIKTLVNELESDPSVGVAFCAVRREYSNGNLKDIIRFDGSYDPNNLSNMQIATKLLSPKKQTRLLKYNLFICGLFKYEAIKEALTIGDDILSYGDRALLSQIALACRFRYVDKVLLAKTVYSRPFKERRPNDEFVQIKKKRTYWRYYYQIMVWTTKSREIPWKRKLFVCVIPYYMIQRLIYKVKKKLVFHEKIF